MFGTAQTEQLAGTAVPLGGGGCRVHVASTRMMLTRCADPGSKASWAAMQGSGLGSMCRFLL